jgi:hypothetical protein
VAEADSGSSKLYKFELDLGAQIDEFKSKSGDYSIALLLGKLTDLLFKRRRLTD